VAMTAVSIEIVRFDAARYSGDMAASFYCVRCGKTAPVQKVCCGRPMKRG